jgi:hypothetical protein
VVPVHIGVVSRAAGDRVGVAPREQIHGGAVRARVPRRKRPEVLWEHLSPPRALSLRRSGGAAGLGGGEG